MLTADSRRKVAGLCLRLRAKLLFGGEKTQIRKNFVK